MCKVSIKKDKNIEYYQPIFFHSILFHVIIKLLLLENFGGNI